MKKIKLRLNGDTAGVLCACIAVICACALSWRALAGQFIQAGDSFWHYANEIHLLRSVLDGQGLFACFNRGMGLPLGSFYQPLLYLIVVLSNLCCPAVSIFVWHNIYVFLLFSVYPLSVYFMVRSFRFGRLVAGLASLLSLAPISGWGHTLDSYFWVGLHTQLIGTSGFTLALGSLHRLTWSKHQWRYLVTLTASLAAVVAGHAVIGVLLLYTTGLYLIMFAIWRGRTSWVWLMKKLSAAGVMAVMLIGFWLIPFIQFNSHYKFIPESQRSFSPLAVSLTVKQAVETFLYGELLDTNHADSPLFGGGEEGFRWSMNQSFYRWRLFTIFTVIGCIMLILRVRKFREAFWLIVFMWGCMLFVGSDDIPWLRFLPFSENFQPIRAVFLIELAAAVISAVALQRTACFMVRISPAKIRIAGYIVAAVVLLAPVIPLYERFCVSGILIKSGCTPDQDELIGHYQSLAGPGPFARTYFGRPSGISKLSLRSLSDCFFISNATGHDNDMAGSVSWLINDYQDELLHSNDLAGLLSLRYIVGGAGWLDSHQKISQQPVMPMERVRSGSLYDVYERKNFDTTPLLPCWKKPVLVYCSDRQWYHMNKLWLNEFVKYGYEVAPMVRAPSVFVHWLEPSLFSALVLIDFPATRHTKRFLYNNLHTFVLDGGTILSTKPLWDIPVSRLTPANQDIVSRTLRASTATDIGGVINVTDVSWNRISADCTFDTPRILWSPTAFYATWRARIDSIPAETFWMSPGVVAFAVSSKSKKVLLEYIPLRAHWILLICGWIGITGIIWVMRKYPTVILGVRGCHDVYHVASVKNCYQALRLFVLLSLIWVGLVYSRQAMERQVVPVYPYPGQTQVNPYEAEFRWNAVDGAGSYHFQISETKKSFDTPVFEVKQLTEPTVGYRGLRPFTRYYWRTKAAQGRWSPVRSFRTGSYYPVATE